MKKPMKKLPLAAFLALTMLNAVWAEDAPTDEAPGPTAEQKAVARKKFKRSKLTHDSSEGLSDRRKVTLGAGEDKTIDLDFEPNIEPGGITTGNEGVIKVVPVRLAGEDGQARTRSVVLRPLKSGETNVVFRDKEGNIRLILVTRVNASNLLRQAAEIRDLLRDVEGLETRVVGQKIVVDGELLVPADYGRLNNVVTDKVYADIVINLATLSPLAMQFLAKKIQEDVNSFAPNVRTRVVNGVIALEGTVDKLDDSKRVEAMVKIYLPEAKPGNSLASAPNAQVMPKPFFLNSLVVNPPPPKKQEKLVRVTFHFVELAKDYNKVFGFKWQPGFTADPSVSINQGGTGASGTSFTATLSSLFPKLQSAQNAGYARVLKTGTVITRSGQPAQLEEQTEYPFTMIGSNGVPQAASKPVGISMAVTPSILGDSQDIQMDLELNQVDLVGRAPATGAPPVTANHKVKTKIYVANAESAAVAGVNASSSGTDFNKDDPSPGTFGGGQGSTEPLFTLLRSKQYRKNKSQFVVFVTPQIIENASDGTEDMKKSFRVKVK